MKSGPLRWLLTFLRYGLCAAALVYLYYKVDWYDHVRLVGPPELRVRLLGRDGDAFRVLRDGREQVVALTEVRTVPDTPGEPEIELGIPSVVLRVNRTWALLAILCFIPVPLLSATRLVWMLAMQQVHLSWWQSAKLTFVGNFFNFALPGTTGGDLIKAYYITRFTHHKTEAVTTVFLDRVIGLVGLVIMVAALVVASWDVQQYGHLATSLGVIFAALLLFGTMIFSGRVRRALRLPELAARLPAGEHVVRIGRAMVAMRTHKGLTLAALLLTFLLQLIVMISATIMATAIDIQGGFVRVFISVAVGFLLGAIPISPPQAFGVMEWAYVQFFTRGALEGQNTVSQAVALALAVRLIQLVWALPGVLVPMFGAHLPRKDELAQMEDAASEDLSAEDASAPA